MGYPKLSSIFFIWVWVNTYRYIFSGMNIHKSQLFWVSLGTRVLTHPHMFHKKNHKIIPSSYWGFPSETYECSIASPAPAKHLSSVPNASAAKKPIKTPGWLGRKFLVHEENPRIHIYPPTPADNRGSASEKRFQAVGAVARRPGPYFRGAGAVLGHTASFLVSSESNVRQWGPWPAGPVRPSKPCCLAVAQAPFWVRQL